MLGGSNQVFLAQRPASHVSPLTTTIYTPPSDQEMWESVRSLFCLDPLSIDGSMIFRMPVPRMAGVCISPSLQSNGLLAIPTSIRDDSGNRKPYSRSDEDFIR